MEAHPDGGGGRLAKKPENTAHINPMELNHPPRKSWYDEKKSRPFRPCTGPVQAALYLTFRNPGKYTLYPLPEDCSFRPFPYL